MPDSCHFRLSSTDGNVSGTLNKQTDLFNKGPSALPLRIIEAEELMPFHDPSEIRQFMDTSMSFHSVFVSSQDIELRRHADATNAGVVTDPFFSLKQTIMDIWKHAHQRPEVVNVLIKGNFMFLQEIS